MAGHPRQPTWTLLPQRPSRLHVFESTAPATQRAPSVRHLRGDRQGRQLGKGRRSWGEGTGRRWGWGSGAVMATAGEVEREGAGGEGERTFCSGIRVSESPLPDPALFSWPSPGERRSTLPLQLLTPDRQSMRHRMCRLPCPAGGSASPKSLR